VEKDFGCHLYGMKNRKACVLDIDVELPSVMLSNVQWKKLRCHLHGMKNTEIYVLANDMELPSVMFSNVQ
jgi:hypothetical protein